MVGVLFNPALSPWGQRKCGPILLEKYKVMAEDPQKAAEYDKQHTQLGRVRGRNNAGAKELAAGYTKGTINYDKHVNKGLPLVCCVSVIAVRATGSSISQVITFISWIGLWSLYLLCQPV